jgi:hypothetical protein
VDDRVAGLIGHAIELVKFVLADGSGETIAHFHGYDAPAVLLVFFNSFAELVELSETELVILILYHFSLSSSSDPPCLPSKP